MTIYYECGIPAKLVPVQFIGYAKSPAHELTQCINAVIRLKRNGGCWYYKRGDVLHVPPHAVVEKAGIKNGFQMVRNAKLPGVDLDNLLPPRV